MMTLDTPLTDAQLRNAARQMPRAVTGPFRNCDHAEAVIRHALAQGGDAARWARQYVLTLHGPDWNAMVICLDVEGWLIWYQGAR
jgi:hypothetical protein